ncbi:isopentenyl-diphosphate Delta-isomerase [Ornithobacterium rhinotracheale]|uniref:isopentenyl-diphosphate Delta-isomerase n=1 Tax=Ornithobacterium rhinotracheale TaxID=28251 RepID=UPI00129C9EC8|nr:isopentenyl-diphosphate Delta-isomerase [Ornithobacterium rhinotracheale]MCK0203930.1 isopentenyl-diphosphate Delta-isomerase [Ornithobacterium rhinotracheale]MRI63826.1 isopentenyl-diphosphate Delta-isomerase [Ornithobacterium rhinotracheale]
MNTPKEEQVVLINEQDEVQGLIGKMQAHQEGVLHRAFSVFVFNDKNETLLQQRAHGKYHSPGLWTNTCCSHPRENETYAEAAHRRIQEEMGFDCGLKPAFHFIYKADVGLGLIEHELDHVFVGNFDGTPIPNPEEVADFKWISMDDLVKDVAQNPQNYTEWFKIILNQYLQHLNNQ